MTTAQRFRNETLLDAASDAASRPLRVCSYEDRPDAMDGLILMGESLCRSDPRVSLHLTVPDAPASVSDWAAGRPDVVLTTTRPEGVTGWDVKPWLLLRELDEGWSEAVWLDADIIVNRPIAAMLDEFPRESLVMAEEWDRSLGVRVSHRWGWSSARLVPVLNSCFIRATRDHRPLLVRFLEMVREPRYRQAQALPMEQRPLYLYSDQWLMIALLESEEFGHIGFDRLRLGRHIAKCAGASGYRPLHRVLDLFRGLPPLIHCIGRKPWQAGPGGGRIGRFATDLAADVSPYVLASRRVAAELGLRPAWLEPRTAVGAALRGLARSHPAIAGLPLATVHAVQQRVAQGARPRPGLEHLKGRAPPRPKSANPWTSPPNRPNRSSCSCRCTTTGSRSGRSWPPRRGAVPARHHGAGGGRGRRLDAAAARRPELGTVRRHRRGARADPPPEPRPPTGHRDRPGVRRAASRRPLRGRDGQRRRGLAGGRAEAAGAVREGRPEQDRLRRADEAVGVADLYDILSVLPLAAPAPDRRARPRRELQRDPALAAGEPGHGLGVVEPLCGRGVQVAAAAVQRADQPGQAARGALADELRRAGDPRPERHLGVQRHDRGAAAHPERRGCSSCRWPAWSPRS